MASKGRRFELNTCKELNSLEDEIVAYPAGYSGNQYGPSPDILITSPSGAYALELKKTGLDNGERRTIIKEDELDMLMECSNSYTDSWIVISMSNRKILAVQANPVETLEDRIPGCFDPTVTDHGNLRLTKPETSEWPSKRKQDKSNAEVILTEISNAVKKKSVQPIS